MDMILGADSLDPGDPEMNHVSRSATTMNKSCLRCLRGLRNDMLLVVGVSNATGSRMFWSGSAVQKRMQSGGVTGPNLEPPAGIRVQLSSGIDVKSFSRILFS